MNSITLIVLSFLLGAASLVVDLCMKNELYSMFQRSGSLIVILGIIFESKYILRLSENNTLYVEGELTVHESKFIEIPKVTFFSSEALNRHTGFYAAILGTLIWGMVISSQIYSPNQSFLWISQTARNQ